MAPNYVSFKRTNNNNNNNVKMFQFPADYLKTCKRKDPNLGECLKVNVQDAIVKLANGELLLYIYCGAAVNFVVVLGAPEIGLKPLDPLDISSLVIGEGSGPVNVKQIFKNVKLHGISTSKVLKYGWEFLIVRKNTINQIWWFLGRI